MTGSGLVTGLRAGVVEVFGLAFDFGWIWVLLVYPISQIIDMASRRNVNYTRLADDDDYIGNEGKYDPRFDYSPASLDEIPWKSIGLALFLLVLGCGLLILSFFVFTGHMGGDRSQAYGLLGLGALTFLPGFYETRIAYYSWRGAQGYRYAAIPGY
ncbi:hypothetical protein L1987_24610 [Smallanthus sonchifolius]|uniref:Uncharacterized protein n=1 Tax=Smallanthus sonchifolius TaxID=185202 RepID=A0ACB9IM84_9ASTR|nr:hypothetical protein L1987_24610 [Smallanthus sonchifolius]